MTRIVSVSDLHLDFKTRGFERADDVLRQLALAVEYANDHRADAFVFLGDLLEGHDPDHRAWTLLGRFSDALDRFRGGHVVLLAGNHDVVDRVGARSALWPLRRQGQYPLGGGVTVIEDVCVFVGDRFEFLCVPHVSRARTGLLAPQEYLERQCELYLRPKSATPGCPLVALCHQEVHGAAPGSEGDMVAGERLEVPRVVRESPEVSMVLCGHIHEAQDVPRVAEVPAGTSASWDRDIHVVGSLERLTFGERGQPKSFLSVEVE